MRLALMALLAGICAGQQKVADGAAVTAVTPAAARPGPVMQNAIERQMQSVGRQMDALRAQYPEFWVRQELSPRPAGIGNAGSASADCSAANLEDLRAIIDREAGKNSVDSALVAAVVEAESANKPCAVSAKGAMGLMQLMPATAESFQVGDPFDMTQNIAAGTAFLKQLLDKYGGDTAKALAAYNAGPGRVDSVGGIPDIAETKDYVKKIMEKLARDKPVGPGKIQ